MALIPLCHRLFRQSAAFKFYLGVNITEPGLQMQSFYGLNPDIKVNITGIRPPPVQIIEGDGIKDMLIVHHHLPGIISVAIPQTDDCLPSIAQLEPVPDLPAECP